MENHLSVTYLWCFRIPSKMAIEGKTKMSVHLKCWNIYSGNHCDASNRKQKINNNPHQHLVSREFIFKRVSEKLGYTILAPMELLANITIKAYFAQNRIHYEKVVNNLYFWWRIDNESTNNRWFINNVFLSSMIAQRQHLQELLCFCSLFSLYSAQKALTILWLVASHCEVISL